MLAQSTAGSPMRPDLSVSRARLALLLGGLAMFGPFSIDTIFPAFRVIAADLAVSPWLMQQTVSIYLIAYASTSLFHGALSDAYGRRRVILGGYSNNDIATKFSISEKTVKHHLTNIFDKLGVSNRLELALFALHHHLAVVAEPAGKPTPE